MPRKRLPDWASLELSPSVESCGCGLGPSPGAFGLGSTGHDQEGRRGLNEVVPGTSVFPWSETGILGNFGGRIKGAKYRFALQNGTLDFSWGAPAGMGLIL